MRYLILSYPGVGFLDIGDGDPDAISASGENRKEIESESEEEVVRYANTLRGARLFKEIPLQK